MLELNDRLLVTSPRTAARRGAIAAARRGQEQVTPEEPSTQPCKVRLASRVWCISAALSPPREEVWDRSCYATACTV